MPRRMDVDDTMQARLRSLVEKVSGADDERVLSVYVNLDPREFGTVAARRTEVESLLDEAERMAVNGGQACIARARETVLPAIEDVDGAQGLAFFCSADGETLETLRLPRPVPPRVVFDEVAYIRPALEVISFSRWCVVLVNRRSARIFLGGRDELRQVAAIRDDVPGQHDQGGWSQARYQRSIEQNVHEHMKHVAADLLSLWKDSAFERVIVSCPEELRAELEGSLHSYVRDRLEEWTIVDVEHSTLEEVHAVVTPLIERVELRLESEALDRLGAASGAPERAAMGLESVLEALNERRVDTLLVAEGFEAKGVLCPSCGWIGVGATVCPVDGEKVRTEEDIVEDAVEAALLQGGQVVTVHSDERLGGAGSVAAVLRYAV